jgi:hypothetical protein
MLAMPAHETFARFAAHRHGAWRRGRTKAIRDARVLEQRERRKKSLALRLNVCGIDRDDGRQPRACDLAIPTLV